MYEVERVGRVGSGGVVAGLRLRALFGSTLVAAALSCAGVTPRPAFWDLVGGPAVTLVNLHPDDTKNILYSVNYQRGGLIPICSEVMLLNFVRDELRFRVIETGREYSYRNHSASGEAFEDHLAKYFGTSCDRTFENELSEADLKGIHSGRVHLGMSKRGTILAIGYPPPHRTAGLEQPRWRYWSSRMNTFIVHFDREGLVEDILD